MADLAPSAVTVLRSWTEGGVASKEVLCRQVQVVLSSMGGASNKILASALELRVVEQVENFVKSDNSIVLPAAPAYDGSFIVLAQQSNLAPADVSGTYRTVVKGQ